MTSTGRLVDTEQRPLKTWRQVHEESAPLLLPVAHDALTAKVIEQAGYPVISAQGHAARLRAAAAARRCPATRHRAARGLEPM